MDGLPRRCSQTRDSLAFGAAAAGGYLSSCLCALSCGKISDFDRIKQSILGEGAFKPP
jgi:hypothetical protein